MTEPFFLGAVSAKNKQQRPKPYREKPQNDEAYGQGFFLGFICFEEYGDCSGYHPKQDNAIHKNSSLVAVTDKSRQISGKGD